MKKLNKLLNSFIEQPIPNVIKKSTIKLLKSIKKGEIDTVLNTMETEKSIAKTMDNAFLDGTLDESETNKAKDIVEAKMSSEALVFVDKDRIKQEQIFTAVKEWFISKQSSLIIPPRQLSIFPSPGNGVDCYKYPWERRGEGILFVRPKGIAEDFFFPQTSKMVDEAFIKDPQLIYNWGNRKLLSALEKLQHLISRKEKIEREYKSRYYRLASEEEFKFKLIKDLKIDEKVGLQVLLNKDKSQFFVEPRVRVGVTNFEEFKILNQIKNEYLLNPVYSEHVKKVDITLVPSKASFFDSIVVKNLLFEIQSDKESIIYLKSRDGDLRGFSKIPKEMMED